MWSCTLLVMDFCQLSNLLFFLFIHKNTQHNCVFMLDFYHLTSVNYKIIFEFKCFKQPLSKWVKEWHDWALDNGKSAKPGLPCLLKCSLYYNRNFVEGSWTTSQWDSEKKPRNIRINGGVTWPNYCSLHG